MSSAVPITPIHIAIIGAGFSGTLVAVHLLRRARAPVTVHLIERGERQFARGVAYSTPWDSHLLNVPAGNMSAFPDDPEHFLRWAKGHEKSLLNPPWVAGVTPTSFLPRRAYGDYLNVVLDEAERSADPNVRLERKIDEVVGLRSDPEGVTLRLASGDRFEVQRAVLALGNFPPGDPWVADPWFYQDARYHINPWAPEVLAPLIGTQSCLLIGSGLTMVDWAITLSQVGYAGTIHAVSRRGLWPNAHSAFSAVPFAIDPESSPPTARAWLQRIRDYIRVTRCDWRAVIDALRPSNQRLWQSLPSAEQRRFLGHLRPYWDCHRHRIAPIVAERLQMLVDSRQLVRHVGRIQAYRDQGAAIDVMIRERGHDQLTPLRVEAVLNCCGSESDYRKLESPLVRDLLTQGLASPDPLLLGLKVGPDGALVDDEGVPSARLYTLGPPQKGVLWETTAVPEIRVQAARLATVLLGDRSH